MESDSQERYADCVNNHDRNSLIPRSKMRQATLTIITVTPNFPLVTRNSYVGYNDSRVCRSDATYRWPNNK